MIGSLHEVLTAPQFTDRTMWARPITWRHVGHAVSLDLDTPNRLVVLPGSHRGSVGFEPALTDLLVPWELVDPSTVKGPRT